LDIKGNVVAGNINLEKIVGGKANKSVKYDRALDPTNTVNYDAQYRIVLGEKPLYVSLKSGDVQ
jgi:hypothetical protein